MTTLCCHIDLPAPFRRHDMLDFHRRDPLMLSERVSDDRLEKGLLWQGMPACLALHFSASSAEVTLQIDGIPHGGNGDAALLRMARRMLGLTQDIEGFEAQHGDHALLAPLLAAQRGLRVPVSPTPFEALSWAITGQQISVSAAVSIRRRLIPRAGSRHSGGLYCYPDAAQLAVLDEHDLQQAGFSRGKTRTLLEISRSIAEQQLPLDDWADAPPLDDIRARLAQAWGIGPWTINYTLLRGFAHLDGSLHGDVAVRRKLEQLLALPDKMSEAAAARWLAPFAPWRALLAAHLWAMA